MKARAHIRFIVSLMGALFFFCASDAHAYVPSARMILGRLARNVGKGFYQVDQELQFRTEGDPLVLRERWYIENGANMFLSVSGAKGSTEGWHLEVLYKDGKRWFHDSQGTLKSSSQSAEFIEPYLYFRSAKSILDTLIHQRVLPANVNAMQKSSKSFNGTVYKQETFVRLARSGGAITYAFGEPTQPNASRENPGFWIDQDAFLFRRLRFPSQAEVQADKHIFASGGMRIPRDRTITWGENSAQIRILSVKSVPEAKVKAQLSPNALRSAKGTPPKLPGEPQVKEFYQRFR